MKKVAIITDTTACISPELGKKYGIGLVPMHIVFGDKVYRNGVDISPAEFYTRIRTEKKLPTTSHPSPDAFIKAYQKSSREAASILCITTKMP